MPLIASSGNKYSGIHANTAFSKNGERSGNPARRNGRKIPDIHTRGKMICATVVVSNYRVQDSIIATVTDFAEGVYVCLWWHVISQSET